jgi:hypothetical protein
MSENFWGLGFSMVVQRFIYRGTTAVTGVGEVTSLVATKNHSGNGWMTSLACGYCDPYIYSTIMK